MSRPLTTDERQKLRSQLIDGVKRVLAGDPGRTLQGVPVADFLAAAEPDDPFGKFQHRSGRAICNRWARGERPQITPGRDIYYRNLCEPYLDSGLPGQPSLGPGFVGGQCAGNYLVFASVVNPSGVVAQLHNSIKKGPIGRRLDRGANNFYSFRLLHRDAQNNLVDVNLANYFNAQSPPRWNVFTCTPQSGVPNNCGDGGEEWFRGVPNPTADPLPGPVGGPPGYGYPGFDVSVDADGKVTINFGDGNGPVTIDPTEDEPTADSGLEPGDIGEPAATADTGSSGDAEGEAPSGQVLVGIKITILASPPTAKQFSDGIFRGAAYCYMGVPGNLGLYPDAANLENGQFIFAIQENLTAWKVSANSGYNLRVTPFYRAQ